MILVLLLSSCGNVEVIDKRSHAQEGFTNLSFVLPAQHPKLPMLFEGIGQMYAQYINTGFAMYMSSGGETRSAFMAYSESPGAINFSVPNGLYNFHIITYADSNAFESDGFKCADTTRDLKGNTEPEPDPVQINLDLKSTCRNDENGSFSNTNYENSDGNLLPVTITTCNDGGGKTNTAGTCVCTGSCSDGSTMISGYKIRYPHLAPIIGAGSYLEYCLQPGTAGNPSSQSISLPISNVGIPISIIPFSGGSYSTDCDGTERPTLTFDSGLINTAPRKSSGGTSGASLVKSDADNVRLFLTY